VHKGQPLDHRHADVVGELKRGSARAAFGAVDDDKVRHDPRIQHRLDHTHEFTLVADAQLEPHRLAARQIAQLAQKLHHLNRRGERRMGGGRDAVVPHRDAPCRRDLGTDLRRGQHATMTGFGTLAQLKLDHLDLVACGLLLEFVGVELPVFCAAAKIARPDFIDQVAAPFAVIAADPAFAGVMGEGLTFVHNTLRGAGIRDQVKLGAAGKVVSAFDIARALALGADWCNSARGFMFAVGCIQAQACHTNHCPVGVATQDPTRQRALDVDDKSQRVARFHRNTLMALGEMTGAAGLEHPSDFLPRHMMMRQSDNSMVQGDQVYGYLPEGYLLDDQSPDYNGNKTRWARAQADSFVPFD